MWCEGTQLYIIRKGGGRVGKLFLMVSMATEILFTVIFFFPLALQ